MYWKRLRRLLGHFKCALRMERRLTLEESYQLLQLAEAIIDYGRMIQSFRGSATPSAVVEIPELAQRFRETPPTIKDALSLLRSMGRAYPSAEPGCWNLKLGDPLFSGRQTPWQGYKKLCIAAEKKTPGTNQ